MERRRQHIFRSKRQAGITGRTGKILTSFTRVSWRKSAIKGGPEGFYSKLTIKLGVDWVELDGKTRHIYFSLPRRESKK